MHDVEFEERLRRALHAEADGLPLVLTADELQVRLAERRRGSITRMGLLSAAAAAVVVVGVSAALLVDRGSGPDVGTSPSPAVTASPTPVDDRASFEELISLAEGDPILLRHERPGEPSHGDDDLQTYVAGTVISEGGYLDVIYDCAGDDPFGLAWRDPASRELVASLEVPSCTGPAEGYTAADVPAEAVLEVTTSPRTSWRLVVVQPMGDEPATPTLAGLPDYQRLAERNVVGDAATETIEVAFPAGTDHLILQTACAGVGSTSVSDGTRTFEVVCTATGMTSRIDDSVPPATGQLTVTVTNTGNVNTVVAIHAYDLEANPNVRFIPPSGLLSVGDESQVGELACGLGFSLANGDSAADSCGPGWPVMPSDRVLTVAGGSELTFSIDGWTITGLTGESIPSDDLIVLPHEDVTWSPLVDMDGGSDTATFAAPPSGDWTIKLHVRAEKGGDSYGVPYVFRVIVGD